MTQKEKISYFQKKLEMQNSVVLKKIKIADTQKKQQRGMSWIFTEE